MPRIRRRFLIDPTEVGVYHCINRCVRRSFLCGSDPVSGKDYEHRRQWLQDRLEFLAGQFGLDVLGFAVMSNHFHVIVRNRPDVVAKWSNDEVARRSWSLRCLVEPIARSANREDACTGRFWEGRYRCQPILDESALAACLAYVDLNPIRARVAETPETSRFTSVYERIQALKQAQRDRQVETEPLRPDQERDTGSESHSASPAPAPARAGWLSPFELSNTVE